MDLFLRFTNADNQEIRVKTYQADAPALITTLIAAGYILLTTKVE